MGTSGRQWWWSVHLIKQLEKEQVKLDQTWAQANMLAAFPLTTARDRPWLSHWFSLGSPDTSTSFFVRPLKKRQWTCHTHQWSYSFDGGIWLAWYFLNTIVMDDTFSIIFLQINQQHDAAPEIALTVRSILLKRKFTHLPLFKIVDFAWKCTC